MQPGAALMDQEVVAACLLRSHLPQVNCVCECAREGLKRVGVCVCARRRVYVCVLSVGSHSDIHVQEDASLTTHIPLDAFKSA